MATTPEGKIKAKIKKILNAHGVYSHMPVQNGMGAPSLDYVCCFKGYYIAIEAKAPGKKPSKRQLKTMEQIRKADGWAFVVHDDDTLARLDAFLTKFGAYVDKQRQRVPVSKLEK